MSSHGAGALIATGVGLLAAPYLARLTLTVPDRENHRWWHGAPVTPARVATTALVAVGLGLLAGFAASDWLVLVPFVLLVVVGAPLIVVDYEHHRLPDRLGFVLAAGAPLLALIPAAVDDGWHEYVRAAAGAGVVFAVLFSMSLAAPSNAFGYGDVKLGGVVGGYLGWFGWLDVFYGIAGAFVLGSVVSLALIATRRGGLKSHFAFGPMLIVGPLVVLAFDLVPSVA